MNDIIILKNSRFSLRPLRQDDALYFFRYLPNIDRFLSLIAPKTQDEANHLVKKYLDEYAQGTAVRFGIEDTEGAFVGIVGVSGLDTDGPELTCWIKKEVQGKGLAYEAAKTFLDWVNEHLEYTVIYSSFDVTNVASRKINEKLGGVPGNTNPIPVQQESGKILNIMYYKYTKPHMNREILDFYLSQGKRSHLDKSILNQFPSDVPHIVDYVQNIIIHAERVRHEKIVPKDTNNLKVRDPATVQEIFSKINLIIISPNLPLDEKSVGICRNLSMLVASVFRARGIPARPRCGFAIYFGGGYFEDHWVCEYWNAHQERWILVDPQMDDYWKKRLHLDSFIFNHLDVKRGQFLPGGEVWKLYREGKIDGTICGFSPTHEVGEYYIRGNMLRDLSALNNFELIYDEETPLMEEDHPVSDEDLQVLDEIAQITTEPIPELPKLKEYFELYIQGKY